MCFRPCDEICVSFPCSTTKPQILLQISATLFSQAALARQENRLDNDTLQTGMSYFLGPLLRWTLVGVIHAMLFEIGHRA
jgi:mediator of RNA polymerase II transcription subunit 5